MISLEKTNKLQSVKALTVSVFFFALACERIFIETRSIENRCYRTGKYTVCKRVSASFSPEILQAGALRGLIKTENLALLKQNADHLCLNMAISTAVTVINCSACKITGKASFALKVHWGENDKGR